MKQIILGIILGFFLNTGLRAYYSYSWWSIEAKISKEEMNASYDQNKYFKIIHDKMGAVDYLKYPLMTPNYHFQRWVLTFP